MDKIADFVKNENECIYCGSRGEIQWDHIRARSKGGSTVVPACPACNQSKGSKQLMVWFRYLKSNNPEKWKQICEFNKYKRHEIANKIRCVRDGISYTKYLKTKNNK